MKLEVILAVANEKHFNGRIYSPEALSDMVKQFEIKKPMFGELGMPSESIVSLKNASHKITSVRIKKPRLPRKKKKLLKKNGQYENYKNINGRILLGTLELLDDTENGKMAKKMFEDCSAVVRPRGFGNVNNGKIQDYSLISFDIINKNDDAFKGLI